MEKLLTAAQAARLTIEVYGVAQAEKGLRDVGHNQHEVNEIMHEAQRGQTNRRVARWQS
jgi:hypothetical protein